MPKTVKNFVALATHEVSLLIFILKVLGTLLNIKKSLLFPLYFDYLSFFVTLFQYISMLNSNIDFQLYFVTISKQGNVMNTVLNFSMFNFLERIWLQKEQVPQSY